MSKHENSSIQLASLKGQDAGNTHRVSANRFDGVRSKRIIAYIIDLVCIAVITFAAGICAFFLGILSFGALTPVLGIILALLPIGYHTFTIGSSKNGTIGMQMMDLEVYLEDGREPDYIAAFFHSGLFYASMTLTSGFILLVSLFNDKGKLLHDFLTGSGVRVKPNI